MSGGATHAKPIEVRWQKAAKYTRRHVFWQHSRTFELLPVAGISRWGGHNIRVTLANGREFVVDDRSKFIVYTSAKDGAP